jgi:hypothetical protein
VAALRQVSFEIACADALKAQQEGLAAKMDEGPLIHRIRSKMWTPAYAPLQHMRPMCAMSQQKDKDISPRGHDRSSIYELLYTLRHSGRK